MCVAYRIDVKAKKIRVGLVRAGSGDEVQIHRFRPAYGGGVRIKWVPSFIDDGQVVLGSGSEPAIETVQIAAIVLTFALVGHEGNAAQNDGFISAKAAWELDNRGLVG